MHYLLICVDVCTDAHERVYMHTEARGQPHMSTLFFERLSFSDTGVYWVG